MYWLLIEAMYREENTAIAHEDIEAYALAYNIDITTLQSIVDVCINYAHLFESDGAMFWSNSARKRKAEFHSKLKKYSEAGKKGMESRWKNNDVITPLKPRNNTLITGKERKGKENKETKGDDIKNDSPIGESSPPINPPVQMGTGKVPAEYMLLIEAHTDNLGLRQAICDWYLMRKAKGKKFAINTIRALQLNLSRARDYGSETMQIKAFEYATVNSHQGLFYKPDAQQNTNRHPGEDFADRNFQNQHTYTKEQFETMKTGVFDLNEL